MCIRGCDRTDRESASIRCSYACIPSREFLGKRAYVGGIVYCARSVTRDICLFFYAVLSYVWRGVFVEHLWRHLRFLVRIGVTFGRGMFTKP